MGRTDSIVHQIQSELNVRSHHLLQSLSQLAKPLLAMEKHEAPSLSVSLDALEKLNKTLIHLDTARDLLPEANKVQNVKDFSQKFLDGVRSMDSYASSSGLSQASSTLEDCLAALKSISKTQADAFGRVLAVPSKKLSPQCVEALRDQSTTWLEWSEKLKSF